MYISSSATMRAGIQTIALQAHLYEANTFARANAHSHYVRRTRKRPSNARPAIRVTIRPGANRLARNADPHDEAHGNRGTEQRQRRTPGGRTAVAFASQRRMNEIGKTLADERRAHKPCRRRVKGVLISARRKTSTRERE